MFAANLVKHVSRRPSASVGYIVEPLTDAFLRIGSGGNVKQALIGFGVLHDGRRFSVHRQHNGAFALLELFHKVAGPAAERRQRLDVLGDVKHGPAPIESTLLGAYRILDPCKKRKPVRSNLSPDAQTSFLLVFSKRWHRTSSTV